MIRYWLGMESPKYSDNRLESIQKKCRDDNHEVALTSEKLQEGKYSQVTLLEESPVSDSIIDRQFFPQGKLLLGKPKHKNYTQMNLGPDLPSDTSDITGNKSQLQDVNCSSRMHSQIQDVKMSSLLVGHSDPEPVNVIKNLDYELSQAEIGQRGVRETKFSSRY